MPFVYNVFEDFYVLSAISFTQCLLCVYWAFLLKDDEIHIELFEHK